MDGLRLEQVLRNLLDNAIRYSPASESIAVEVVSPSPDEIQISVTDRGIGIPSEQREEIFERFHQAHAASHRSGMGLGLSISRQIVELHGGTLAVEFPSGGGTRFVVRLPRSGAS